MSLVPWLGDHIGELTSFDDVKLLDVQLNRLRRWYTDGLLLIGDAAHAMSPVGGVGINLAVADAVAAAGMLAAPLRAQHVSPRDLARTGAALDARRADPGRSARIHARVIAVAVSGDGSAEPPLLVRMANRFPPCGPPPAYAIAVGPLAEHTPGYARR